MDNQFIEHANGYFAFGSHHLADRWAGYSEGARAGAVCQAHRQFERALGRAIAADEARWTDAIAEQALALLVNSGVATQKGEGDTLTLQAQAQSNVGDGFSPAIEMAGGFSREALRVAGWNGVSILRG